MKKYTVITKNGSKWLRPVLNPSDTDQLSRFFQNAGDGFEDLPYIGSRPEGTTVDESEVREVRQYRKISSGFEWTTCPSEKTFQAAEIRPSFETRTAYTDAESHHHISDNLKVNASGERFWCKIVEIKDGGFVGKVDNDLVSTDSHGLALGDLIFIRPNNIYQTWSE